MLKAAYPGFVNARLLRKCQFRAASGVVDIVLDWQAKVLTRVFGTSRVRE